MLNYASIINIIKSDEYIDKTECFAKMFPYSWNSYYNCKNTGSSLWLKTFACFLDKQIDAKEVFRNLAIGKDDCFEKEANTFTVLYFDFSDFNADCYSNAISYLKRKMSDVYKHFSEILEENIVGIESFETAIDIIEESASENSLKYSLKRLIDTIHRFEKHDDDNKLAVLIDNLVRLEEVADKYDYYFPMRDFLEGFIADDIYKRSEIFVQIGDYCEDGHYFDWFKYEVSYRFFCTSLFDMKKHLEEAVVGESEQHLFEYNLLANDSTDWNLYIKQKRGKIEAQKNEAERIKQENIRREIARFAVELSPEIIKFSPNLGLREKHLDKSTPEYFALTSLLKKIYREFAPNFDYYNIYKFFQKVDENNRIVANKSIFEKVLQSLAEDNPNWNKINTNGSSGYWVQVVCTHADDVDGQLPIGSKYIKAYAHVTNEDARDIFVGSLKYLLENAQNNFAAKIAVYDRSDQMCYWLTVRDFRYLEDYYSQYADIMEKTLPFTAYKGMLGISKEFPYDSHNATQARIISDYFKTVTDVENVDLDDMYNNFIAEWNADIYPEDEYHGFKNDTVFSFVMILDTLDCLLGRQTITDKTLEYFGNEEMWEMFRHCRCWADVNEYVASNRLKTK